LHTNTHLVIYKSLFIFKVETQLREKPLWGNQTQNIHYLENKASYKVVAHTYPMQWLYLEL